MEREAAEESPFWSLTVLGTSDFIASRTVRNTFVAYKPPSLWYKGTSKVCEKIEIKVS